MNTTAVCPFQSATKDFKPYYSPELHAAFEVQRRTEPVFWCEEIGYWVLTKHSDVYTVLHDGVRFSSENTTRPVTPMCPEAMAILKEEGYASTASHSTLYGDVHKRTRAVTSQKLNLREFVKLESHIRRLVAEAIERIEGKDEVDLLAEVNYELPAHVVFKLMGIPDADVPNVKKWAGARSVIDFSPATHEQQLEGARNMAAFWQYCAALVADRQKNPGDDFTSQMLAIRNGDDSVISIPEIITHTFGVAFAGHETTTNQLTNTFRSLLENRSQWEALCADPTLAANTVEEGMRYAGAVIGWRRVALEEVEFRGVKIPKGAPIMLSFASANRDEEVFPEPHSFDIRRANARKQLTFGNGVHFCLGAPLARLEMKIVFEEFAKRFPKMRLVQPDTAQHLHTFVFRAPDALRVTLQ
ncbi:cytochrome P450 [Variovorax soli]|uniref:Cytochrome P450 n=1 Tax=Variovorax soli TaxID=376815 RepID=A0ABU1NJG8_9BURK|nr:cytochrome P450 [Variovorax soli]MDR6538513.1 cytochrome P450 [Variovorax soli]